MGVNALDLSAMALAPAGNGEFVGACPFCGDTKKHFYANLEKGVYKCFRCGAAGRIDRAQASIRPRIVRRAVKEEPLASVEALHRAYSALLEMLTLSEEHRRHLLSPKRGLTPEKIAQNGYKTLPSGGRIRLASALAERVDLTGVPGFYLYDSDAWCLAGPPGLAVPVRDFEGKIRGIQVRRDDDASPRYLWLSSARPKRGTAGTKARTWFHVAAGSGDEAWITEGPLKADIAAFKTGRTFIAVPGVQCWKSSSLIGQMKMHGVKSVVLCYDADVETNHFVAEAAMALGRALKGAGIRVRYAWWDRRQGKGIDDLLLAGRTPWILTEASWLRRLGLS